MHDIPTFHFIPEMVHLLMWFDDVPDAGDPACICSLCKKVIVKGEMPLRIFRTRDHTEIRLHISCANKIIVELAVKP